QRTAPPIVSFPEDRRLLGAASVEVAVHAVVGEVQPAALEPPRPRQAPRDVAYLRVRVREAHAEVADDRVPVPLRLRDAPPLELFQRADAERAHEAREARALRVVLRGPPDDLAASGLGHAFLPRRQCTRRGA